MSSIPSGFGNQENPAVTTNSLSYTTLYTIPVTNFKPNSNYIILLQWQCYNTALSIPGSPGYTVRARFNGNTLNNGEFVGSFSDDVVTAGLAPNHMVMTRITQPSTPQPITIEAFVTNSSYPVTLDYVRWIVLEESTINPFDYTFNELTVPYNVENAYGYPIVTSEYSPAGEDWVFFYCARVKSVSVARNKNVGYRVALYVNDTIVTESQQQSFNDFGVTRSTFMMLPRTALQISSWPANVALSVRISNSASFTPGDVILEATGSVLALKTSAFQGTQQVTTNNINPAISKTIPPGNWLAWNIGSNLNVFDPSVISNGLTLPSQPEGTYAGVPLLSASSAPQGFDWRIDSFAEGTYDFEYDDLDVLGNARQAVFLLESTIPTYFVTHSTDSLLYAYFKNHTTNSLLIGTENLTQTTNSFLVERHEKTHSTDSYLSELKALGHDTSSQLCAVGITNHSTDAFIEDRTISGISQIDVGISIVSTGVLSGTAIGTDINCYNRRLLYNYAWDPSLEKTRNPNNCKVKR